ncbi:hypothetical protein APHAL10511_008093 [Amanita phalloides]|nr:hypothetical protein APHAL10511_008093 [Amanita phalloides]
MVQFSPAPSFAILALLIASVSSTPLPVATSDFYERDINELQARGPGGALELGKSLFNKHSSRLMDTVRKHIPGRSGGHSGGHGGHSSGHGGETNGRQKPWSKFRIGLAGGRHSGGHSGGHSGEYRAERNPGYFGVHPDKHSGRVSESHGWGHHASQALGQLQMPVPQSWQQQQQQQPDQQQPPSKRDILDMEERGWDYHDLDARGYFDDLD